MFCYLLHNYAKQESYWHFLFMKSEHHSLCYFLQAMAIYNNLSKVNSQKTLSMQKIEDLGNQKDNSVVDLSKKISENEQIKSYENQEEFSIDDIDPKEK